MSDTDTRAERRSALDEFANLKTAGTGTELATVSHGPPADYIHGAQLVPGKPRDEMQVLQRIKVLAAAAGDGWYYRFPVKDNKTGRTSYIEGPSIKLANAVALIYGNCEVDVREQDLGSAFLFHARFFDVESGFALTRPFQQSKGGARIGGSDDQRRINMAEQIGVSKAARNVVVNALQTYCDFAFEEAKEAIVDKIGKDLPKWRDKTVERFGARVDIKRVEAVIGRTADKWLAPDIARIIAMGRAVEEGMAALDETFPPLGGTSNEEAKINTTKALDQFASDDQSMVNADAAAGPSAGSSETVTDAATTSVAVDRLGVINQLLGLASEERPEADKLERLDVHMNDLIEQHKKALHPFIKEAAQTAARVAKGDITLAVARQWLEQAK